MKYAFPPSKANRNLRLTLEDHGAAVDRQKEYKRKEKKMLAW